MSTYDEWKAREPGDDFMNEPVPPPERCETCAMRAPETHNEDGVSLCYPCALREVVLQRDEALRQLDLLMHVDAAALEIRRWKKLLQGLIDSLPKCDGPHVGACRAPATKALSRGGARWCDDHAPTGAPDYPRAAPLREALDFLKRAGAVIP